MGINFQDVQASLFRATWFLDTKIETDKGFAADEQNTISGFLSKYKVCVSLIFEGWFNKKDITNYECNWRHGLQ